MKILVKILVILMFVISPAYAADFDVLVLPADLILQKENYYNFYEMSVIIANDIIKNFNYSNGKIKSPDLYAIRENIFKEQELKTLAANALNNYKNSNHIDYETLKKIGEKFKYNYIILISSSVTTNKNSLKRGVWEVLEVSSDFETNYPYRLETSIVMIDTANDIVMWSNKYSIKLGTNSNIFNAENFAQANDWLEKMKLYSKSVIAPSVSQNITLRFFPKSIRPVEHKIEENSGGALKFERNLPGAPKKDKSQEVFYGDMIYGI